MSKFFDKVRKKTTKKKTSGSHGIKVDFLPKKSFSFEKKLITQWRQKELASWFDSIGFSKVQQKFLTFLENGEELLQMDKSMDIGDELGKISGDKKKQFFVYYHHLKECAFNLSKKQAKEDFFTLKFHTVFQKFILKNDINRYKIEEVEEHCSILSDSKKIEKYLLNYEPKMGEEYDIKLVFTEVKITYKEAGLLKKKLYTPQEVNALFPPHYGDFNIYVFIGPFYLQWDSEGLLTPIQGKGVIIDVLLDSDPIIVDIQLKQKGFNYVRSVIAELVENYNTKLVYAHKAEKSKLYANCKTFFTDVLKRFNTNLDGSPFVLKKGALKQFINKIPIRGRVSSRQKTKKTDTCSDKVLFQPQEDFVREFKLSGYKNYESFKKVGKSVQIEFSSHKELDDFMFHCFSSNVSYYACEHKMLKAIDRSFWLRHIVYPKNPRWEPLPMSPDKRDPIFGYNDEKMCGCRFLDPQDSIPLEDEEEKM